MLSIRQGVGIGTLLHTKQEKVAARKQGLAGAVRPSGSLILDEGACNAITRQGKSLLAVGVLEARGDFSRGDLVQIFGPNGLEIGRGLVNYTSLECRKIIGMSSSAIEEILGFVHEPELIHRDNLLVESIS